MHMHRWAQRAAAVAAGLSLVGLSVAGSVQAAVHRASSTKYTVALIPGLTTDPFYISMAIGAKAAARHYGINLVWEGATTWSASAQTPYVNAMVARHVNALLIAPTDVTEMIPPIKNAVKAHIPVITVDTTIKDQNLLVSAITSNNFQGGQLAAQTLATLLHGKGQVAVINVQPGITTTDARQAGFLAGIKKYPGIHVVAVEYDNDSQTTAATQAQHLLLRYPHLGGIFGTNLYSAVGAAQGVREANAKGKVYVFGYDAEPLEVQDLKAGLIYALVAQKPYEEGYLAVEYAYDYLTGHKNLISKHVQLPNVLLTRSNLSQNSQWIYKTSLNG